MTRDLVPVAVTETFEEGRSLVVHKYECDQINCVIALRICAACSKALARK